LGKIKCGVKALLLVCWLAPLLILRRVGYSFSLFLVFK